MKALRLMQPGLLRLKEEPPPSPKAGEALLRVKAVGICGSDLHWFAEAGIGDARLEHPLVLGHEFAGVVEGGDMDGVRVAVEPAINCNNCEHCWEGNPNLCLDLRFAGSETDDGAMQQYMAWPKRCLFPLPDTISLAGGAMLEPLGVAIHAVDLAHLRPGMTVAVFGCGPIGLLLIQMARAAGAGQIIATDPLAHRLDAAVACGADHVFQTDGGRESAQVRSVTAGGGVHVAFEAAGENEAVETAVGSIRRGGRLILAGIPVEDRTSFSASVARRLGLTIMLVRRMKHTYPRAIRLAIQGKVDLGMIVSHEFDLEDFEQAFTVADHRQGLKVVLRP